MLIAANYHYIRESFNQPFPSIFGVTPINFKKQLIAFKNEGEIVLPSQLLNNYEEIVKSKTKYYIITFDDGLKEQYNFALPILEELNTQALFFINSLNYIEKKVSLVHKIHLVRAEVHSNEIIAYANKINIDTNLNETEKNKAANHYKYDDYQTASLKYLLNFKINKNDLEKIINTIFNNKFKEEQVVNDLYMTKNQLTELASKGMLGSHTHSHFPLGTLPEQHIFNEINQTKQFIQSLGYGHTPFISYPYGSEDACKHPVPEIAKGLGYSIGLTMFRGSNTGDENKLLLKRFACNDLIGYTK